MIRNRTRVNIAARSSIRGSAIVDHLYVLLLREGRYMKRKTLEGAFPSTKNKINILVFEEPALVV